MAFPHFPGVPPLLNRVGSVLSDISLLVADALIVLGLFNRVVWGIFDQNGKPVIVGTNTKSFEFDNEFRISDYPVEQGGFASYNKVATPFDIKLSFTKQGNLGERTNFLLALDSAIKSLYQFVVVTPEVLYTRVNVVRYNLRRTQKNGATLLTVDVWCREVRQAPDNVFSNSVDAVNQGTVTPTTDVTTSVAVGNPTLVQQPSGASPINNGTVQAQVPAPVNNPTLPGHFRPGGSE